MRVVVVVCVVKSYLILFVAVPVGDPGGEGLHSTRRSVRSGLRRTVLHHFGSVLWLLCCIWSRSVAGVMGHCDLEHEGTAWQGRSLVGVQLK